MHLVGNKTEGLNSKCTWSKIADVAANGFRAIAKLHLQPYQKLSGLFLPDSYHFPSPNVAKAGIDRTISATFWVKRILPKIPTLFGCQNHL